MCLRNLSCLYYSRKPPPVLFAKFTSIFFFFRKIHKASSKKCMKNIRFPPVIPPHRPSLRGLSPCRMEYRPVLLAGRTQNFPFGHSQSSVEIQTFKTPCRQEPIFLFPLYKTAGQQKFRCPAPALIKSIDKKTDPNAPSKRSTFGSVFGAAGRVHPHPASEKCDIRQYRMNRRGDVCEPHNFSCWFVCRINNAKA